MAGTLWRSRTVEGDLGMRWSATGVIEAAPAGEARRARRRLAAAAAVAAADPDFLPSTATERAEDLRSPRWPRRSRSAGTRAANPGAAPRKDLRDVRLVIGSGGVLRHAPAPTPHRCWPRRLDDLAGGWPLPRHADAVVDVSYVLAPAGLLASEYPDIAVELLRRNLLNVPEQ